MEELRRYLPRASAEYVSGVLAGGLLGGVGVEIAVVPSRRTKLGDHRGPRPGRSSHRITLNDDLNPHAFLTTLLHEIAHVVTWELHERHRRRFARRVKPHGPQWRHAFGSLLAPVVSEGLVPEDVCEALARSLRAPRAATCSDRGLLVALSRYDAPDPGKIRVEEMPEGATFRIPGHAGPRTFRKGGRLRSRFRCWDAATGTEYRIHGLCPVEPCGIAPPVTPRGRRRA